MNISRNQSRGWEEGSAGKDLLRSLTDFAPKDSYSAWKESTPAGCLLFSTFTHRCHTHTYMDKWAYVHTHTHTPLEQIRITKS